MNRKILALIIVIFLPICIGESICKTREALKQKEVMMGIPDQKE